MKKYRRIYPVSNTFYKIYVPGGLVRKVYAALPCYAYKPRPFGLPDGPENRTGVVQFSLRDNALIVPEFFMDDIDKAFTKLKLKLRPSYVTELKTK